MAGKVSSRSRAAGWFVRRRVGVCALTALLPAAVAAADAPLRENAIPTCYEQMKDQAPRAVVGDLTVIVDQTVGFDQRLQQIVLESVERLIEPGTRVSVVGFSAFLPGRYLDVLVSGQVESRIAGKQRDYLSKRVLFAADQCLDEQLPYARRLVAKALKGAFGKSDSSLARSDILTALHDLSRRIGEAPAERRLVIVVSDMLENSSITSFYQGGQLRKLDVDAELKKVAAAGIRADFHRAQVVVIGAGIGMPGATQTLNYRDPRAMLALEDFWRKWFAASNAGVAEFGKPTPLVEIKWVK